jgi:hypothetical protein
MWKHQKCFKSHSKGATEEVSHKKYPPDNSFLLLTVSSPQVSTKKLLSHHLFSVNRVDKTANLIGKILLSLYPEVRTL